MKNTTTLKRKGHKPVRCNARLEMHYAFEFNSPHPMSKEECVGKYMTGPDGTKYLINDVTNTRNENGTYDVVFNAVHTEVPRVVTFLGKDTTAS